MQHPITAKSYRSPDNGFTPLLKKAKITLPWAWGVWNVETELVILFQHAIALRLESTQPS
jgi:hypothetical protein